MEEIDLYGSFNSRYEGVGHIVYVHGEIIPVYFEARQLYDGRLIVACVSTDCSIRDKPQEIAGKLFSGEEFSTMWGRVLKKYIETRGAQAKLIT